MELTHDEMVKACNIARGEVAKRTEQFKPGNSVIKNEEGFICEEVFKGVHGDDIMCGIVVQWVYPSAGAFGRIMQVVHVRLTIIHKDDKRFLRVINFHLPVWNDHKCTLCGGHFSEHIVIVGNTSLHEY